MDIVTFREYCLSLPEADETLPFDDDTLVYKVSGRMFAMISISRPDHFAVKCHPDRALLIRDRYAEITPGWHLNKHHWNDVSIVGELSDSFLKAEIRHSYFAVVRNNVTPRGRGNIILTMATLAGIVDDAEWIE
ncbi:MAG: MmcQ/YjbR family DNA-binding protein [Alistipes sp.]|nr:MmcQ/YjbR family DNA-binding protein [Alistipes sp.]